MSESNPIPGDSGESDRRDDVDLHSCWGKAREIQRRTGILLGLDAHDIVSEMCREWGTANADEFYERMNAMGDSELKAYVEDVKKKIARRKWLQKQTITVEAYA